MSGADRAISVEAESAAARYERSLDIGARRRAGVFFTPRRLVEFVLAFAVRGARDRVLDPSCGAGGFLVAAEEALAWPSLRAKREAGPREAAARGAGRKGRGAQLWGFEIDGEAAGLARAGLSKARYRCEVREGDFFDIDPSHDDMPRFDAVVGNPPYVRHERVGGGAAEYKRWVARVCDRAERGVSGHSDLYASFVLHAAAFLRPGGRIAFVTSNAWLDAGYGRGLREFLLKHFRIVALVESRCERWFEDAAVNTVVLIAEREDDEAARDENDVRFVQLQEPLAALLQDGGDGDGEARWRRWFALAADIEAGISRRGILSRGVRQSELRADVDTAKWGPLLRAPEIWFELSARLGARLRPLADVAAIGRGCKTGINAFFYVDSSSAGALPQDLRPPRSPPLPDLPPPGSVTRKSPSLGRAAVLFRNASLVGEIGERGSSGRVIGDFEASRSHIEQEYLLPILKSPREVDTIRVDPARLSTRLFYCPKDPEALARLGHHGALAYIAAGAGRRSDGGVPWPEVPSVNDGRPRWYTLRPIEHTAAQVFWPLSWDVRLGHRYSDTPILADQRLAVLRPLQSISTTSSIPSIPGAISPITLAAALNSALGLLATELAGRVALGDGALDLPAEDARRHMRLPDPALLATGEIHAAFEPLLDRPILPIHEEVLRPDRRAFDIAVFRALGLSEIDLDKTYRGLCDLVRARAFLAREARGPSAGSGRAALAALTRPASGTRAAASRPSPPARRSGTRTSRGAR